LRPLTQLFIIIGLSISAATAVPDSVITGPYNISFDLGLDHDEYRVNAEDPIIDETLGGEERTEYPIWIIDRKGNKQFIKISILAAKMNNPMFSGPELEMGLKSTFAEDPRVSGLSTATRTIDGRKGAVASMTYKYDSENIYTQYVANYQPMFDPHHSSIFISSTYPWNDGTLQLFKTIRIEKTK